LTVVILPIAALLVIPPAGQPSDVAREFLLLPLCCLTLEGGVFLAARSDTRSLWQRGVALLMLSPAIFVFFVILMNAHNIVLPANASFSVVGAAIVRGLVILCMSSHVTLATLLLLPRRREALAA